MVQSWGLVKFKLNYDAISQNQRKHMQLAMHTGISFTNALWWATTYYHLSLIINRFTYFPFTNTMLVTYDFVETVTGQLKVKYKFHHWLIECLSCRNSKSDCPKLHMFGYKYLDFHTVLSTWNFGNLVRRALRMLSSADFC